MVFFDIILLIILSSFYNFIIDVATIFGNYLKNHNFNNINDLIKF
jgi:hypothetical protein